MSDFFLDGTKSKWWLYSKAAEISQENVKRRQLYLVDTALGKPAPLYDLGVTPLAVAESVGPAGLHCPVSVRPNTLASVPAGTFVAKAARHL